MIFIIEQGGKVVGAMSLEKDKTYLMLNESLFKPVTVTMTKTLSVPVSSVYESDIEDGAATAATYLQDGLIKAFGPAEFGVGIDLEANERNQKPSTGHGGRRFCLDERLGNS